MDWIAYVVAFCFALLGIGCLILVVIGLPGTWVLLGLALLIEIFDRHYLTGAPPVTFGWWTLGICAGLALVGEALETLAGVAGTKAGGGSRRGMVGAMLGGLLGAIVFTPLIPIPVIGTLIGALIGTFLGALIAERTAAKPLAGQAQIKAAGGATIGRLLGTVSKAMMAASIWVVLTAAAFWP